MSNFLTIPRNGRLTRRMHRRNSNFPSMFNLFDDLYLGDFPTVFSSTDNGLYTPKVNIVESDDAFTIEMAVPGMKKSDFEINLDNDTLTIAAKIEKSDKSDEDGFVRREFSQASFSRSFTLPETVNDSKIDAKYNDGILQVNIPKRDEAKRKPNRIIDIA